MSTTRLIKLGDKFSNKYAQESSLQEDVSARDALEFLIPIAQGKLVFGRAKAQQIINYLNDKISRPSVSTKPFADASYMDSIIGNMVYSGLNDNDVATNAAILLDALADQKLESTGSFPRTSIVASIERYKEALRRFRGDGAAASNWSAGMPQRVQEQSAQELAEQQKR
jgi:hypothetical protein